MRPHKAYSEEELADLYAIAKNNSRKAYALVMLLYDGACRIQDVVGMPYSKITEAIPDEDGAIVVKFEAKKTTSRLVSIAPEVV